MRWRDRLWTGLVILGLIVGVTTGLSLAGIGINLATALFACMATLVLVATLLALGKEGA